MRSNGRSSEIANTIISIQQDFLEYAKCIGINFQNQLGIIWNVASFGMKNNWKLRKKIMFEDFGIFLTFELNF